MDRPGDSRPKRKASPVAPIQRPSKQLRPDIGALIDSEDTPRASPPHTPADDSLGDDGDDGRLLPPAAATADSAEWQATIERVVRNVVSIHFCQTCSFDTDSACSSEATGFVVDAEKGYILTNRHVVCAGPFWGYCIFDNHEEVSRRGHKCERGRGADW